MLCISFILHNLCIIAFYPKEYYCLLPFFFFFLFSPGADQKNKNEEIFLLFIIYLFSFIAVKNLLEKYNINPKDVGRLEVGTETILDKAVSHSFLFPIK